jgi:structural maintenance of chromosome 2
VTTDFGAIFSTLLPGTTAKLEPVEGCSFMDGEGAEAGRV